MTTTPRQLAISDKNEILSAIDSRMAKLGADHDAITRIEEMLKVSVSDRKHLNDAMFGPNGDDGVVGFITEIKGKLIWIYVAGGAMFGAIGWLIGIHLK